MFFPASFGFRETVMTKSVTALVMIALGAIPTVAATPVKVVASVPGVVAHATDRGPLDPASPLRVTVWLAMHNKAEFDQRVEALYTPGSATYQKWLTTNDLLAYAPTKAEVQMVKTELEKSGLTTTVDEGNPFVVRAEGSADQMKSAFGTQINTFETNGKSFHANITEAHLTGDSANLVLSVSGLSNRPMESMITQVPNAAQAEVSAQNAKTVKPAAIPVATIEATKGGESAYFTNQCFQTPTDYTFGAPGQLPVGVYYGNVYYQKNLICGYTPAQMQSAYGLAPVYGAGLKGAGQTIVILIPYGSPTIFADVNNFNKLNGLPAITSLTFSVMYPSGKPTDLSLGEGWIDETSLDVEWTHAIAPSAKIIVLAAASGDDQDLQYGIQYATMHKLGSVISNSYALPEVELSTSDVDAYNQVIEQAAATGISVNYASGDKGDEGFGTPVGAVSAPADSPYATAVGGTSIGVPGGTGTAKEVGWGNNETALAYYVGAAQTPPVNYGMVEGAGGGSSLVFPKPSWQKALPGTMRQVPDVSMDADPFTGVIVSYTDPVAGPVMASIGGTSLACPMFSALWALANEKAGHWLGQASPIISRLPSTAMHDILPVTSPTNVAGTIISDDGANFYSASQLAAPLENTTEFVSAMWPVAGEYMTLTFGTTSSLTVTKGWDNVTGYGSPVGLPFITAAAKE